MNSDLQQALERMPLVAILRGITPRECVDIGRMLVDEGFSLIEVPLNSPQPLLSIERLVRDIGERAVVGAGTVLQTDQVRDVASAGGRLVVSPNARADVVAASKALGMISIPGFATASEAFAMLDAGADALKLFPAEAYSPAVVKALRAVLPADVAVLPVGGIDASSMASWQAGGAGGFGLGSALYRAGDDVDSIRGRARQLVAAWRALC